MLRCSLAATTAFLLASALGLLHPVWACISAIVVSQEKLQDTKNVALWRLAGTLLGVAVAGLSGCFLDLLTAPTAVQISCAVALSAALVRWKPDLKVAMWTAPIVLLNHQGDEALLTPGLWRGAEVLVGGLVGAGLHALAEAGIRLLHLPDEDGAATIIPQSAAGEELERASAASGAAR